MGRHRSSSKQLELHKVLVQELHKELERHKELEQHRSKKQLQHRCKTSYERGDEPKGFLAWQLGHMDRKRLVLVHKLERHCKLKRLVQSKMTCVHADGSKDLLA